MNTETIKQWCDVVDASKKLDNDIEIVKKELKRQKDEVKEQLMEKYKKHISTLTLGQLEYLYIDAARQERKDERLAKEKDE